MKFVLGWKPGNILDILNYFQLYVLKLFYPLLIVMKCIYFNCALRKSSRNFLCHIFLLLHLISFHYIGYYFLNIICCFLKITFFISTSTSSKSKYNFICTHLVCLNKLTNISIWQLNFPEIKKLKLKYSELISPSKSLMKVVTMWPY